MFAAGSSSQVFANFLQSSSIEVPANPDVADAMNRINHIIADLLLAGEDMSSMSKEGITSLLEDSILVTQYFIDQIRTNTDVRTMLTTTFEGISLDSIIQQYEEGIRQSQAMLDAFSFEIIN